LDFSALFLWCALFGAAQEVATLLIQQKRTGLKKATENMPVTSASTGSKKDGPSPGGKKDSHICPICDNAIRDAVGKRAGHEAVECSGSCSTWLHRHCAGLSRKAFEQVSKSDDPFFCPQCRLDKQDMEIQSLRQLVSSLSSELSSTSSPC